LEHPPSGHDQFGHARIQSEVLLLSDRLSVITKLQLPNVEWISLLPSLRLVAAAKNGSGNIVVLLGGRGGWHRTILLVYSNAGV